jgi:hypothetical protein
MDRLYIGTNANAFFFPVGIHGYWDGCFHITRERPRRLNSLHRRIRWTLRF